MGNFFNFIWVPPVPMPPVGQQAILTDLKEKNAVLANKNNHMVAEINNLNRTIWADNMKGVKYQKEQESILALNASKKNAHQKKVDDLNNKIKIQKDIFDKNFKKEIESESESETESTESGNETEAELTAVAEKAKLRKDEKRKLKKAEKRKLKKESNKKKQEEKKTKENLSLALKIGGSIVVGFMIFLVFYYITKVNPINNLKVNSN